MGYHQAGFDVIGVDINPQPRYPFDFHRADVLELPFDLIGSPWAAIHASPPCQRYSDLARRNGNADEHPDLIGTVRELLEATGLPYVIENVEGAPLREPALICGTALALGADGYRLRRHRLFETSFEFWDPSVVCACGGAYGQPVIDVTGGGPTKAPRTDGAGGRTYKGTADQARRAMGIDWMTKAELNEAIPPAYTRRVGAALLEHLEVAA